MLLLPSTLGVPLKLDAGIVAICTEMGQPLFPLFGQKNPAFAFCGRGFSPRRKTFEVILPCPSGSTLAPFVDVLFCSRHRRKISFRCSFPAPRDVVQVPNPQTPDRTVALLSDAATRSGQGKFLRMIDTKFLFPSLLCAKDLLAHVQVVGRDLETRLTALLFVQPP